LIVRDVIDLLYDIIRSRKYDTLNECATGGRANTTTTRACLLNWRQQRTRYKTTGCHFTVFVCYHAHWHCYKYFILLNVSPFFWSICPNGVFYCFSACQMSHPAVNIWKQNFVALCRLSFGSSKDFYHVILCEENVCKYFTLKVMEKNSFHCDT